MKIPDPFRAFSALCRVLWGVVTRSPVVVPVNVEKFRLKQCRKCPHLHSDLDQCGKCTCFVVLKCSLATEKCPDGRWGRWLGRS